MLAALLHALPLKEDLEEWVTIGHLFSFLYQSSPDQVSWRGASRSSQRHAWPPLQLTQSQSKLLLDTPVSLLCQGRRPGPPHSTAVFPRETPSSLALCTLWWEAEVPASLG